MTIQLNNGIRLLSGAMFDYNKPEDCNVLITDIAAALSKICRFSGHINQFYSVAQHAVNTSLIVPIEYAFDALMHDTAEAFTNDLPTPLKYAVPIFKQLEVNIESAMSVKFGFKYPLPNPVQLADSQMLKIEKLKLKHDSSHWSILDGIEIEHIEHLIDLSYMDSVKAEKLFLDRFQELSSLRQFECQ